MEHILNTTALLVLTSLVIVGINLITSGKEITLPDGTKRYSGKLLYFIRRYFEQYELVRIYKIDCLDIASKLNQSKSYRIYSDDGVLILEKSAKKFATVEKLRTFELELEEISKMKVDTNEFNDKYEFQFYINDKNYRFSDYVKDPIMFCLECMSSVWGSIAYWTAQYNDFIDYGSFGLNVLMWFVFLLALVSLNNYSRKLKS